MRRGLHKSREDAGERRKSPLGGQDKEPWQQGNLILSFNLLASLCCKPLLSSNFLKHLQLTAGLRLCLELKRRSGVRVEDSSIEQASGTGVGVGV